MRLIATSGFDGPVGFLNWQLTNPSDYLARTMQRWQQLCRDPDVALFDPTPPQARVLR